MCSSLQKRNLNDLQNDKYPGGKGWDGNQELLRHVLTKRFKRQDSESPSLDEGECDHQENLAAKRPLKKASLPRFGSKLHSRCRIIKRKPLRPLNRGDHQFLGKGKSFHLGWAKAKLFFSQGSVILFSIVLGAYRKDCREAGKKPLKAFYFAQVISKIFGATALPQSTGTSDGELLLKNIQLKSSSDNYDYNLLCEEELGGSEDSDDSGFDSGDTDGERLIIAEPLETPDHSIVITTDSTSTTTFSPESTCIPTQNLPPTTTSIKIESTDEEPQLRRLALAIGHHLDWIEDANVPKCNQDGKTLVQIIQKIIENNQLLSLLSVFGHSASCSNQHCSKLCLMFKKIRLHLATKTHVCPLMSIYGEILKLHVDFCSLSNCGLIPCKELKKIRCNAIRQKATANFSSICLKKEK